MPISGDVYNIPAGVITANGAALDAPTQHNAFVNDVKAGFDAILPKVNYISVATSSALKAIPVSVTSAIYDGSQWLLKTIASQSAAVQAAITADTANGIFAISTVDATRYWERQISDKRIRSEWYAANDNTGNQCSAWKIGLAVAVALGWWWYPTGKTRLAPTTAAEAVAMPDGTKIDWTGGGEIVLATFGVPGLYNFSNQGKVTFRGTARGTVSYTAPKGLAQPAISTAFNVFLVGLGLNGDWSASRESSPIFGFYGTDIKAEGFELIASDFTDIEKMIWYGITVGPGPGIASNRAKTKGSLGDIFFDGCAMGLLQTCCGDMVYGDIRSKRWFQPDLDNANPNAYGHSIPCHVFYGPSSSTDPYQVTAHLKFGNLYDEGIELFGSSQTRQWGAEAFKINGNYASLNIESWTSFRGAGAGFISAQSGSCGPIYVNLKDWAEHQYVRGVQLGATASTPLKNFYIESFTLDAPANDQGGCACYGDGLTIAGGIWRTQATQIQMGSNSPFAIHGQNINWKMDYDAPNILANQYTLLVTMVSDASNVRLESTINCPDFKTIRVIEQVGSNPNNIVMMTDRNTGMTREITGGCEIVNERKTGLITVTAGVVSNLAGFIPAESEIVGIATRLNTAPAGTATGFTVGDGTTANRWGTSTSVAVGAQATLSKSDYEAAGKNVVITPTGGTFTGNGQFSVVAQIKTFRAYDYDLAA